LKNLLRVHGHRVSLGLQGQYATDRGHRTRQEPDSNPTVRSKKMHNLRGVCALGSANEFWGTGVGHGPSSTIGAQATGASSLRPRPMALERRVTMARKRTAHPGASVSHRAAF